MGSILAGCEGYRMEIDWSVAIENTLDEMVLANMLTTLWRFRLYKVQHPSSGLNYTYLTVNFFMDVASENLR